MRRKTRRIIQKIFPFTRWTRTREGGTSRKRERQEEREREKEREREREREREKERERKIGRKERTRVNGEQQRVN